MTSSPIALVLSGGAAKGAYQAGVWQALCEFGLAPRVRVFSGTSVGAINAAAFATVRNPIRIREFWHRHVADIPTPNYDVLLSPGAWNPVLSWLAAGAPSGFPFRGLLDRRALERVLEPLLPGLWPEGAPAVYATAVDTTPSPCRLVRFPLHREPDPKLRLAKILASAAIPWGFDPVTIAGHAFVDGVVMDNLPIAPVVERYPDIRLVIAVRCNVPGVDPAPSPVPPSVRLRIIQPSSPLPGVLDGTFLDGLSPQLDSMRGCLGFTAACADESYRRGLADGRRVLPGILRDDA